MTGLIFLAVAIAMMTAVAGYRGVAIGLFGVSFVGAVLWLFIDPDHKMSAGETHPAEPRPT